MKKFILSIFIILSFGFYVIWQNLKNPADNSVASTEVISPTKNTNTVTKSNPKPVTVVKTPTSIVVPKKNSLYNDGEYVGDSVDAYYGNVQVKVVISGGKLADVVFLDHPQDRGTSIRINNYAMPLLKQEAIQAQSANVNGVSGASATSPAFIESLKSALDQAKV